jgi:lipid-binding SYLF domain-containing protein
VRDEEHKTWSEPAFMTLGGVSFGPQIGGQSSEVILVALSDRGVRSLLANSFKLSGEAGLAVGPIGMGAAAATANLSADIVSFSRSKGLYGGLSLDGAVVAVRSDLNDAYYGRTASPTDILIKRDAKSAHDTSLSDAVGRSASGSAMGNCPSAERPRG